MLAGPEEAPHEGLHRALVEILRQLNRDEMEDPDVPGLELEELQKILALHAFPQITRQETDRALEVLVRNGLARELDEPKYAWTRCRTVSLRFTITTPGKAYLVEATQRAGRI